MPRLSLEYSKRKSAGALPCRLPSLRASIPEPLLRAAASWLSLAVFFAVPICAQDLSSLLSEGSLARASGSETRKLVIPSGVYRLEHSKEGPHLFLNGVHDLEIDARGALIVFGTPGAEGLVFDRCSRVVWRGGVFTHAELPFSQGRVEHISSDGLRLVVRVADGYPTSYTTPPGDRQQAFYAFDAVSRRLKTGMLDIHFERLEKVDGRRFAAFLKTPLSGSSRLVAGDLLAWRGAVVSDVRLTGCGDMLFDGVTVRGGSGLCFFEGDGPGRNSYSVRVTYPERPEGAREDPLLSSNADAFHSAGMRVGPRLTGCRFEGTGDDGIAIHGNYARVVEARGSELELAYIGGFGLKLGDRLQIADHSGRLVARATAAKVGVASKAKAGESRWQRFRGLSDCWLVTVVLDAPVDCRTDYLVANENASGSGFEIRDCVVRHHRARGMLIKAGDGVIEGNLVEGSSMGGIIVGPEMGIWAESGYSNGLVVKGNRIRGVGFWRQDFNPMAGALTVAAFEAGSYVPLPGGHENVVIEGNLFEENDGINLLVTSTRGIRISENSFVKPLRNPQSRGSQFGLPRNVLAVILESAKVDLRNNWISEPGKYLAEPAYAPGISLPGDAFVFRSAH